MDILNQDVKKLVDGLNKFANEIHKAMSPEPDINQSMNELLPVVTEAIEILAREHSDKVENQVVLGAKFAGHLLTNLVARARAQKLGPLTDIEKYVCIEDILGKVKESLTYSICLDSEFDDVCEVDHG